MREGTFHIVTFGCQMNVHDSLWMAGALRRRGMREGPLEDAQAVIVNTCSVREKPELKVTAALGRIARATGGNPGVLVAVTGCVAQQLGAELFRHPQVRLVAGSDGVAGVPGAVTALLADPGRRLSLLDFTDGYVEREQADPSRTGPVALVNIMQGCDNFCAYCIVPFTRGRQKSRATAAILDDCRRALDDGAREICVLGQNVNAFGRDRHGDGTSFADLLRAVAALPGLERLRYVTPHPADMGPEDVALFGELPQLCPRLHLPLQAGSDAVLARMGRRYDAARYRRLVEDLRRARPDLAISADLIVGFPGETEEDFQETLRMMRDCALMSSFSFVYSDRPGTRASRFTDKIPREVGLERLGRLQALQDELAQAWLDSRVGAETEILIEGESPRPPEDASGQTSGRESGRAMWGRDPHGVPVHVILPDGGDAVGALVATRVTAAKKHCLTGERRNAHG